MRRSLALKLSLFGLVLIIVVAFAINFQRSRSGPLRTPFMPQDPAVQAGLISPTATRLPWCAPLPKEPDDEGPRTPTPDLSKAQVTLNPYLRPSVTPLPYTLVVDMDPQMPDRNKSFVVVYRCGGTIDLYKVVPVKLKDIPLGEGDVILHADAPLSLMEYHPIPTWTEAGMAPSGGLRSTIVPYPYPQPTVSLIPNPYPGPTRSTNDLQAMSTEYAKATQFTKNLLQALAETARVMNSATETPWVNTLGYCFSDEGKHFSLQLPAGWYSYGEPSMYTIQNYSLEQYNAGNLDPKKMLWFHIQIEPPESKLTLEEFLKSWTDLYKVKPTPYHIGRYDGYQFDLDIKDGGALVIVLPIRGGTFLIIDFTPGNFENINDGLSIISTLDDTASCPN